MKRRGFLQAAGAGLADSAMGAGRAQARPNVIVILVDDWGWNNLGCYGSKFYETPNIDAMAARGIRFTDGYAAHPVCSPTRAAIMTGKNPCRKEVNITDWIPGLQSKHERLLGPEINNNLPHSETTLAETMKAAGYATWHLGKWHLGETEASWPQAHGFDVNVGGHSAGSPRSYYSPYKNPKLEDGPDGEYLTDRLTSEAINLINKRDARPFFMYLAFYTVHTPIQACKRHLARFEKKKTAMGMDGETPVKKEGRGTTRLRQDNAEFASMVFAMDENVGRLLDALKQTGIDKNTFVVLLGDNGGLSTLQHDNRLGSTCLLPLRAGKGWGYEGGIRVPFIVQDPAARKGVVCSEPVVATDIYATVLERCGLPPMPQQAADSVSLVPLLKNPKGALERTQPMVWHFPHYHGSGWCPGSSIRDGDWKLVEFYHDEKTELFNLKDDLGEQNNLAAKHPEKAAELKKKLYGYLKATGASMAVPNLNPGSPPQPKKKGAKKKKK